MSDKHQNRDDGPDPRRANKKLYEAPVLREFGNMAELTQGTGLVLLDIVVQGSITVAATATVLG